MRGSSPLRWLDRLQKIQERRLPDHRCLCEGPDRRHMQSRAEEYRERAKECEQKAAETRDPEAKEGFSRLARLWAELAEQTEQPLRAG